MGRAGINRVVVQKAVEQLRASGIQPSARNVRKVLGSGSFSTIQQLLNELEVEALHPFGELGMVSGELADLVLQLHDKLKSISETELAAERQKAWAEAEGLRKQLQEREEQLAERTQRIEQLTQELERSERVCGSVTTSLNDTAAQLASTERDLLLANQSLAQRQQELSKAERIAELAQQNLEALQTASEEARRRDYQTFEADRNQLRAQITTLESQLRAERETTNQFRADAAVARERLIAAQEQQERTHAQLAAETARFQAELTALSESVIELRAGLMVEKERTHYLTAQCERQQAELESAARQIAALNTEIEVAQQMRKQFEAALDTLSKSQPQGDR